MHQQDRQHYMTISLTTMITTCINFTFVLIHPQHKPQQLTTHFIVHNIITVFQHSILTIMHLLLLSIIPFKHALIISIKKYSEPIGTTSKDVHVTRVS